MNLKKFENMDKTTGFCRAKSLKGLLCKLSTMDTYPYVAIDNSCYHNLYDTY